MDAFAHCENLVREADKDRFLASLFAPAEKRRELFALYAFNLEIAGVQRKIREPFAGEVWLQYWHDVISGIREPGGNPVALSLLESIGRNALPGQLLLDIIEAHRFDIYDESFPRFDDLEQYARKTASRLIELAMRILGEPDAAERDLAHHGGIAYAITGLLRSFAFHASRGKVYVPEDLLAAHAVTAAEIVAARPSPQLRDALAQLRRQARHRLERVADALPGLQDRLLPAMLSLALVRSYLARMERADYDPFRTPVDLPQWRKQWLLWRAARNPRRIAE
jgi:15-cis-phytoene synthase